MHVLILADGEPVERHALDAAWPGWDEGVDLVIAADGGARQAERLDLAIDAWVGDADSLEPAAVDALVERGVEVTRTSVDKDETDAESAIGRALEAGATRLTIVGGLGGRRLDHGLANVAALTIRELADLDVRLLGPSARVRLLLGVEDGGRGDVLLEGRAGDIVTLLPVGEDAHGVTTVGLRYPLRDEVLVAGRTRGVSNVRLEAVARVTLRRGRLLLIEAPATLGS
jgi:thiamine pyrophosphokinase